LQTAVAASLAWTLATVVLGHESLFFASIATVISLGVAGQIIHSEGGFLRS
jgi:uncharacterized membrane protein YgaE (UPF0421/DUF939 family)